MEIKKEIKVGGINYVYINPDDFTFRQFKIGRRLARKIMPLLKAAGAMTETKTEEIPDEIEAQKTETKVEIDTDKLIELLSALDEMENGMNECDIIALCYINVVFSDEKYNNLRNILQDLPEKSIAELRVCIPDFFTYIMPRLTEGILTSLGTMTKPENEDGKNTENTVG